MVVAWHGARAYQLDAQAEVEDAVGRVRPSVGSTDLGDEVAKTVAELSGVAL